MFESNSLVWKLVLAYHTQILAENVVYGNKVNELRGIFIICGSYVVNYDVGNVLHFGAVVPERVEIPEHHFRHGRSVLHDPDIGVIAAFTAKINSSKTINGIVIDIVNVYHTLDMIGCHIGAKFHFPAYPVSAFFCYGFLGKFVAQLDFKLSAIKTALTVKARYVEFPLFLFGFFGSKCKNKTQFINSGQCCL